MNKNTWKKLPPDIQQVFKEEAERLIDSRAFALRETWHQDGVDGVLAKGMEHIPLTSDIHAAIKEVLRGSVVPAWVKRAGGQEAAQLFNQIAAPSAGFTVAH
jgi:TRAP-type C4-dicarboxylate transport system substrate-binding protein